MQHGHQLRHLGHLNLLGKVQTVNAAGKHAHKNQRDDNAQAAGGTGKHTGEGGNQGNKHTQNAGITSPLCCFLFGKSGKTQNKQNCGDEISNMYKTIHLSVS